ncbi:MAG: hypothetical protein IT301_05250 [Dehalococcoidia bacterium]|nr:hypothetical protein [Dehalococcoidia bacterium]
MYQPRIPTRFESSDGSEVLTFPLAGFTVDIDQDMDTPDENLSGVDGTWDSIGDGEAPLKPIVVRLSFEAVEEAPEDVDAIVDDVLAKLRRFGTGKLWTVGRDSLGADVERWGYFRATAKPSQRWRTGDVLRKQLLATFRGGPYWMGDTAEAVSEAVTDSPHTLAVVVPGTGPVYWMTIRVISESAAGFANVVIENLTNGYSLTGTRDAASADDIMRIDTEFQTFEFTDDAGATYSDDYASWTLGALQIPPFRLEGGQTNNLRITCAGTQDYTFEIDYYPVYE